MDSRFLLRDSVAAHLKSAISVTQRFAIVTLLFIVSVAALAQIDSNGHWYRDISPAATDPRIAIVHGSHIVSSPDLKKRKNRLLISISGTGGSPNAMNEFDSVANFLGFHTISLDYKNEVVTTVCRPSLDSTCFDAFRQEIVFGTLVSDSVRVDSVNSIYNRIYCLLRYLSLRFPSEGWNNFFRNKTIIWESIVVAGHSQGAGHAAFLGKYFTLNKAIILAGPQDFLDHFNRPAPWISRTGKTPGGRYFALLHYQDQYGFMKQLQSCLLLSKTMVSDTVSAMNDLTRAKNILVSHLPTRSPHGSVIRVTHLNAWRFLLLK